MAPELIDLVESLVAKSVIVEDYAATIAINTACSELDKESVTGFSQPIEPSLATAHLAS